MASAAERGVTPGDGHGNGKLAVENLPRTATPDGHNLQTEVSIVKEFTVDEDLQRTKETLPRLLEGRVALITGASRGLGREIAEWLGRSGAKIALNHYPGMKPETIAEADELMDNLVIPRLDVLADVSKSADVDRMVQEVMDKWGRVDILVNNAGIVRDNVVWKMPDEDIDAVINTNLKGPMYTTRAVVPIMRKQGSGRIINIASIVGQEGNFAQTNYAGAKGGLIAVSKTNALELARFGITVNAVCPGFSETDMTAAMKPDVLEQVKASTPIQRMAKPGEIAAAVTFLAGPSARFITGQEIGVNGGRHR